MSRLSSSLLLPFLLIASSASAVTMDWTPIGNPGNACDPQSQGCFGSVGYEYKIGTYEVTMGQYAEFLNAKAAASDPLGLYNSDMGSDQSGISRTCTSGLCTYSAIAGRDDYPVNLVSFYDALRFANWMNNGQGNADTETGAYTLLGGAATPSNGATVTRNAGAAIVLSSEDEWYKAAYYSASSQVYFDYPAGSDQQTVCKGAPLDAPNRANCDNAVNGFTTKGLYTNSPSPSGTFDQGGNAYEWNEVGGTLRGIRGGAFNSPPSDLAASSRIDEQPTSEQYNVGFRVAMIPEPSTGLLVMTGLLGLAAYRRQRA
jgi:formylglycine-generating enzyme required for sulfatase activity